MTSSANNAAAANQNTQAQATPQQDPNAKAPADGTLQDVCVVEEQNSDGTILIERPVGETKEITLEPGKNYVFGFEQDTPLSFVQNGDTLTITFDCGGVLILKNYSGSISGSDPST